jgi:hypothetical protein
MGMGKPGSYGYDSASNKTDRKRPGALRTLRVKPSPLELYWVARGQACWRWGESAASGSSRRTRRWEQRLANSDSNHFPWDWHRYKDGKTDWPALQHQGRPIRQAFEATLQQVVELPGHQ